MLLQTLLEEIGSNSYLTVHAMTQQSAINGSVDVANLTETLEQLNARFAEALLPLTITFGIFTFLGFLGNLIIILVFALSRDYRRNNFKVFVLTLAVIDIITCVTLIPAEMVKQRHYFDFGDVVACKVKCFFNVFGATASCLALLVISVDRYRKVVQPFKKQLDPKLAMKILFCVAFIFPILLAIPGTVMCGISKSYKKNLHGGYTEIYMCETEERFRLSIWRTIYKFVFIILLFGVSFSYIVLYVFVMKEAAKQIRAIRRLRKTSSYEVAYSSDVYDPNSVYPEQKNGNGNSVRLPSAVDDGLADGSLLNRNISAFDGSVQHKSSTHQKVSKQFSVRSMRSQVPMIRRQKFPTKTLVWFVLTVVFIISYMTHIILSLKVSEIVNMTTNQFAWFSFFFRIYFVNHMINPVVYAIFVKRFRQSCRTLIPLLHYKLRECCL